MGKYILQQVLNRLENMTPEEYGKFMDAKQYIDSLFDEGKTFQMNSIILESMAEKEVERFLKHILPDSPYAGLVKAVGGYVRDEYMSMIKNDPTIEAKDLDIVVGMKDGAEKVTKYIYNLLGNSISEPRQLGKGYPIWQITFKKDIEYNGKPFKTEGAVIEFADAMKEDFPDANSRQRVTIPSSIEDDIARRDFTVNMLLKDMTTGEIEDLTGQSKDDIKNGVLRGHPKVSLDKIFTDDPLRMIRLVRFQAKYGWKIPMGVLKTVKRNAERITIVSNERIMGELKKVMEYGKLAQAIRLMSATGLLKYILPEVEALKGVQQNPDYHSEGDAYTHTMMVLKNAKAGVENQIAALLHDIGKPQATKVIEGKIKSLGHEEVGADIAEDIMKRLKFDNDTIDKVKLMVRSHMRPHNLADDASPKAIRKFVREVGDSMVDSILDLSQADELGKLPQTNAIPALRQKIKDVMGKPLAVKKKSILNGEEIMELLNIKQGSEVGRASKIVADLEDEYGEALTKDMAKEELLKRF